MKYILALFLSCSLFLGCKKSDTPTEPGDELISISGKVVLPNNSGVNISGLEVNSGFTSQILNTDTYKIDVLKNEFSSQYVTNAQGKNILMGYYYPTQTDFTINSTSTILGILMETPSVSSLTVNGKLDLINKIKANSKFPTTLAKLEDAIRSGISILIP